ncbi:hypothetical protein DFH06DRAFT_1382676, partial [Mycena polygramma]
FPTFLPYHPVIHSPLLSLASPSSRPVRYLPVHNALIFILPACFLPLRAAIESTSYSTPTAHFCLLLYIIVFTPSFCPMLNNYLDLIVFRCGTPRTRPDVPFDTGCHAERATPPTPTADRARPRPAVAPACARPPPALRADRRRTATAPAFVDPLPASPTLTKRASLARTGTSVLTRLHVPRLVGRPDARHRGAAGTCNDAMGSLPVRPPCAHAASRSFTSTLGGFIAGSWVGELSAVTAQVQCGAAAHVRPLGSTGPRAAQGRRHIRPPTAM